MAHNGENQNFWPMMIAKVVYKYNVIIAIIILLLRNRDAKVIRQDQEPKRNVLMKHNHSVTELNLMLVSQTPYILPGKVCVCV
jgi:hypothetical protein